VQSITKEVNEKRIIQQSPLYPFMYALKSSEARRQYPKRLKMLFDYLKLQGSLEEQSKEFLDKTRQNDVQWAQDSIMIFLDYHKERVRRKELAAGTLKNYYRAAKLFCEMNDLILNWKRISKGLPRAKNSSNDRAPTTIVKAMQIRPTIVLDSVSRMADFEYWGEAIARAMGYKPMDFVNAYRDNRKKQNVTVIEFNQFATTVVKFCKDQVDDNNNTDYNTAKEWEGTLTELLDG
jgi:hypothetical protein